MKQKLLISLSNTVFGVLLVSVLQLFLNIERFGWLQMMIFAIVLFFIRFMVELFSSNVFQRKH